MGHLFIAKLFIVYCLLVYAQVQCQYTKESVNGWILKVMNTGFLFAFFFMFLWAIYKAIYIPPDHIMYYLSDDDTDLDNPATSSSSYSDTSSDSDISEANFIVQNKLPNRNSHLTLSMRGLTLDRSSLAKNNLIRQSHHICGYSYSKSNTNVKFCAFCQENGQPEYVYRNHNLKDRFQRCTCPILQLIVCPICKGTGNRAHTVQYCPYSDQVMKKEVQMVDNKVDVN